MFVYLLLFLLAYITAVVESKRSLNGRCNVELAKKSNITPLAYFAIAVFMCLCGFRYELGGSDYEYYDYFYGRMADAANLPLAIATSEYEPGYTAFIYVCTHYLHLSFNGYLLLEALVFYVLMYFGLRKYIPNWGIFLMFFMYKMYFYVTFVAMRQAITVAGFYMMYQYLQQGKYIKYYLWLILIASFHYGALLLFLIYPFARINFTKDKLKVIGIVFGLLTIVSSYTGTFLNTVVSIIGLSDEASDKAAGYSGGKETLNILYTIEYYVIYILLVQKYDVIVQCFKNAKFIIALFVMVLPIVTVFRSTIILVRELPYFYPAYAVIFTYIFIIYKRQAKEILLLFSIICLAGVIKYVIEFGNGCLMPYRWWLFNPDVHIFAKI